MNKRLTLCAWLLFIFSLFIQDASAAIKLKLALTNPSSTEERTIPLKSYLPKGVEPEMILDKGSLEIGYNYKDSLYYVYGDVKLKPQEAINFEITFKDVWVISEEEINILSLHVAKVVEALKGSSDYEQAKVLGDNVAARLLSIKEKQAAVVANMEDRLGTYEMNIGALKLAKKDLAVLEDLAVAANAGLPDKMKLGESGDEPVVTAKEMIASLDLESLGVVKFEIEISNPSGTPKTTPIRLSLPVEVISGYVVSADGLEVNYDYKKAVCYVSKESITLAPKETKKFIIMIKDVWAIPQARILEFKARVKDLIKDLENTEYHEQAQALADKINVTLDNIILSQEAVPVNVERHIGDYRGNLKKYARAKKELLQLEALLVQVGGKLAGTFKAGDASASSENQEGKEVSSGGKTSELVRGAKGLKLIAGTIFKGKAPTASTTWKIIWMIIGFLAVVSFLFFMLWWFQVKKNS